jgi:hypothetical protein
VPDRASVPVLGVLEQPFRGGVERAYADIFFLVRVLRAQLGGLDLLLRGAAVLTARRPEDGTEDGTEPAGTPAAGLRAVVGDGVGVLVQTEDLSRFSLTPGELVDGVQPVTAAEATAAWSRYESVWFL